MSTLPLVLTIDIGTQSCRTALINNKGEIEGIIKRKYQPLYFSKEKGWAEQDPNYYFDVIKSALKELSEKYGKEYSRIKAATITTFRDSPVQLDENMVPVRPMILWCDQRQAKASEKLPLIHRILFDIIGMRPAIDLNRMRTPAHWIKENEPDTWKKVKKYVNISGYLVYLLTGKLVDGCSNVTGHFPINFKKRVWYKEGALKSRIYGLKNSMLCELKQPGEELGIIKDEIAKETGLPLGLKLIATGSDKACETIGLGALSNETAAVSYGTASSIEVSNKKYHEPEPFLPAYPAGVSNWYNMEVQIYRGYWMLSWFTQQFASDVIDDAKMQELAAEELLNAKMMDIAPGSDGLVLQPYWGPGLHRPLSKGAIIGFTDIHTRYHMYRAIIEGIAYGLKEGLIGIEKRQHHKVKEIKISGGGSQSDAICQITADIFGLPVSRVQTYETTSLGAAIATFMAIGEFKDINEANKAMVHKGTSFIPNADAFEKYQYLFKNVYVQMFPRLKNIYKDISTYRKTLNTK